MTDFTQKPDFFANQLGNVQDARELKNDQFGSEVPPGRFLTNKRLCWFTFFAWLVGLPFLSYSEKTYDPDSKYRVVTYRQHRDGSRENLQDRTETGAALNQKEIEKVSRYRVTGICAMVFAISGTVVIGWRLSNGQLAWIRREHQPKGNLATKRLLLTIIILLAVLGLVFVALPRLFGK